MSLNRQEIFKAAHRKAKLTVINTRCTAYARTYAQAFAEALRFEYSKVRGATQRQAMRNEQNTAVQAPIQPIPPVASSSVAPQVPQPEVQQAKPRITARAGGLTA